MAGPSHVPLAVPERVRLELPVAGLGHRALAWLVDAGLLLGLATVGFFAYSLAGPSPGEVLEGLSTWARVAAALAAFALLWGYWTVSEAWSAGQTVGKRLLGIRVVRADGQPVTFADSALRNLLRAVDFLPFCYPVGLVTMLLDSRHRRLGDLAAGTLLVRDELPDLSRYDVLGAAPPRVSADDADLVARFLARAPALEVSARRALGLRLAARLGIEGASDLDEASLLAALAAAVRPRE